MALWGFYFLVKIALYYKGVLQLDAPWNLAFAIFLLIPHPKLLAKLRVARFARGAVNVVLGLSLLWHDSWLAPLRDTIHFIRQQGLPSPEYILGHLLNFFTLETTMPVLIGAIICVVADRYVKLVPVAVVVVIVIGGIQFYGKSKMDVKEVSAMEDSFFDYESSRVVNFQKPKLGEIDFDIIFIHVCSLAWDDMKLIEMGNAKFFDQFHYRFTNFNGVTTYSGPAALRILRAPCGQTRHIDLYNKGLEECYSMETLKKLGFETYFAMNHNGKYGGFLEEVSGNGHVVAPLLSNAGLLVDKKMFDGSPLVEDYSALANWWKVREKQAKHAPAALYYNTVTLHDGVTWAGMPGLPTTPQRYKEFLSKLFADVTKFFGLLSASGKNFVVVFIPEHGVALRGSAIQTPGLRDIPLPSITSLPVAIKFIGPKYNDVPVHGAEVSKPISYLAVAHQLKYFIEHNPFAGSFNKKAVVEELPTTDFVSENESARIILVDGRYYYQGKDKKWVQLSPDQM
ncbi:MAG: cellulose biosynthesis protein BcsG [Nitrospinae bacterium]|nr:cellulose biosynthesis protein BcsG [Nitrospinota bacterium]